MLEVIKQSQATRQPAQRVLSENTQPGMPNEPVKNFNNYSVLPLNLQGDNTVNEQKFKEYQMRLNELLNVHKTKNSQDGARFFWVTSNFTLMFLENSIRKYTRKPVFNQENPNVPTGWEPAFEIFKPKLISW